MRQIYEYAKMAYRNIMGSKMRSFLTMLGIIIGIGAVIMVLCIGGGGQRMMDSELGMLSSGSVYLSVTGEDTTVNDYFTDGDVEAVGRMEGVAGVTMAGGAQRKCARPKGRNRRQPFGGQRQHVSGVSGYAAGGALLGRVGL